MLYFGFWKLDIYQLSKALVKDIYKLGSTTICVERLK